MASLRKTLFETLRMFSYTHTLAYAHARGGTISLQTHEGTTVTPREGNQSYQKTEALLTLLKPAHGDWLFSNPGKSQSTKEWRYQCVTKKKQTNRKQSISEIVLNNWIEKRERKWWKLENTTKFHRKRTKTRSDPNRTVRQNNLREIEIYWFRGLL